MACRVGITTNPGERKRYWQSQHPSLRNWKIIGRYKSKSAAQDKEGKTAKRYGCVASPGGKGLEYDDWCVYMFEYDSRFA